MLMIEETENLKGKTLEELAADGAKHGVTLILIIAHATELGGKTADPADLE